MTQSTAVPKNLFLKQSNQIGAAGVRGKPLRALCTDDSCDVMRVVLVSTLCFSVLSLASTSAPLVSGHNALVSAGVCEDHVGAIRHGWAPVVNGK